MPTEPVTAPKPGPSLTKVTMPAPPSAPAAVNVAQPSAIPESPAATDHGPAAATSKPLDDMFERIGDKYGRDTGEVLKPPGENKKAGLAKSETPKAGDDPAESAEETGPPDETKSAGEKTGTAGEKEKGKKPNPWKEREEYRRLYEKSESENLRLRKLIPDEAARQLEVERFEKTEAQNKELLEHLRFLDYQKHPEFQEKHVKPYDDKWRSVMRRLAGVSIMDGESRRPVEPKDIAELGRLPADQAIELAEQKFGRLGQWVSERVEELRQLDEEKWSALERVKKEGLERQQQMTERQTRQQKEISDFLRETWDKATQEMETHSKYGEFFKPKEGDDEFNARLEKGTELVDNAFSRNPADPSLTPTEREGIIKRHAAVRQRARAFGPLNLTIERLRPQLSEVLEKLKQYEASTPEIEGGQQPEANGTPQGGYTMDTFERNLARHAKPMV